MPKVHYKGIAFDSELEQNYYQYLEGLVLKGQVLRFKYHPKQITNLVGKRSYTPDFLVQYNDHWEVVETKGYNPYSKMIDDAIHAAMLSKDEEYLMEYVIDNGFYCIATPVVYKKIKFLKAYGFVDWDFKNPNTIANKRKEKIQEQTSEIKELKEFKKNAERFFNYHLKIVDNQKLTKSQLDWYYKYVEELRSKYNG